MPKVKSISNVNTINKLFTRRRVDTLRVVVEDYSPASRYIKIKCYLIIGLNKVIVLALSKVTNNVFQHYRAIVFTMKKIINRA